MPISRGFLDAVVQDDLGARRLGVGDLERQAHPSA
jgi:hypothetical protein